MRLIGKPGSVRRWECHVKKQRAVGRCFPDGDRSYRWLRRRAEAEQSQASCSRRLALLSKKHLEWETSRRCDAPEFDGLEETPRFGRVYRSKEDVSGSPNTKELIEALGRPARPSVACHSPALADFSLLVRRLRRIPSATSRSCWFDIRLSQARLRLSLVRQYQRLIRPSTYIDTKGSDSRKQSIAGHMTQRTGCVSIREAKSSVASASMLGVRIRDSGLKQPESP